MKDVETSQDKPFIPPGFIKMFRLSDLVGKTLTIRSFKGEVGDMIFATDTEGIVYILKGL